MLGRDGWLLIGTMAPAACGDGQGPAESPVPLAPVPCAWA